MHEKDSLKFGIIKGMYNWSTDTKRLKKNEVAYEKWRLEQLINFGLGKEKISKRLLKKYWKSLHLDPSKKEFLKFLLKK